MAREFGCTDITKGLTTSQAAINREKYGPNALDKGGRDPIYKIFLSQFWSPVVLLLLVAAIASLVMKEWVEGAAILIIVTLNACLATYMENSGEADNDNGLSPQPEPLWPFAWRVAIEVIPQ